MSLIIKALDAEKKENSIKIDSEADFCPLCNRNQAPVFISAFKSEQNGCQVIFQCSNKKCLSFYIAYYHQPHPGHEVHYLRTIAPRNFQELSFESEIKELSPNFCEIYQEASYIEILGYKQVAGTSYRKALEYLIKDFCIKNHPGEEQKIKNSELAACMADYVDDPRLKECALRAQWLGNDEKHYIRRWEDKDITEQKALIQLTRNWIIAYLQAEKYIKETSRDN
jgi:hypothetical protein